MNKIKKYFLILLLAELVFSFAPAYAQTTSTTNQLPQYSGVQDQIQKWLCTPDSKTTNGQNVLFQCINQVYKFSIALAGVVGVFFLVIAGYIYMSAEGNSESINKAKEIITSTLAAIVILLAGYLLLKAINPDLIQFQQIQPPNVTLQQPTTGTTPTGGGTTTTAGCSGCVDLTTLNIPLKPAQGTQATASLAQKLQQLSQTNQTWRVNEAYPPTTTHSDPCHSNGSCVDIALTGTPTTQALAQLCTDAKAAGLSVYNEYDTSTTGTDSSSPAYAACGASQNPSTRTGNNLHVQ